MLRKIHKVTKEVLILVNLLLAAVLMAALVYFGAAIAHGISQWKERQVPPPADQTTTQDCPPGESYSNETGLCYPGEVE